MLSSAWLTFSVIILEDGLNINDVITVLFNGKTFILTGNEKKSQLMKMKIGLIRTPIKINIFSKSKTKKTAKKLAWHFAVTPPSPALPWSVTYFFNGP